MSRFEMNQIRGVIPAMLTFFDKEENVDTDCTRRMVEFMLEHGADGFYLTGSTGECFTMTMEERNLVVDTVIDQVKGRVPVIVHVGDKEIHRACRTRLQGRRRCHFFRTAVLLEIPCRGYL